VCCVQYVHLWIISNLSTFLLYWKNDYTTCEAWFTPTLSRCYYSAWACPLCRLEWVPGESKQAYHMIHQPVSVSSRCSLIAWLNGLASGDQRRLTGSGSTLMPCSRRWAIQMAVFTLLYFTCYTGRYPVIQRTLDTDWCCV